MQAAFSKAEATHKLKVDESASTNFMFTGFVQNEWEKFCHEDLILSLEQGSSSIQTSQHLTQSFHAITLPCIETFEDFRYNFPTLQILGSPLPLDNKPSHSAYAYFSLQTIR